jgi:uncharacterized RDD family membrane protein YckC
VKCPKCGFVSFPGLAQCRKCGSPFEPSERAGSSAPFSPDLEEGELATSSQFISSSHALSGSEPADSTHERSTSAKLDRELEEEAVARSESQPKEVGNAEPGWASELSERVADFRRRRENPSVSSDRELTLPFNKADPVTQTESPFSSLLRESRTPEKASRRIDVAFGQARSGLNSPSLDFVPSYETNALATAEREPELIVKRRPETPSEPHQPLDSDFAETAPLPASDFAEVISAPLGKRFVAGVLDGLVLLSAASVFVLIAWLVPYLSAKIGGHIQLGPLNLAVLMTIASFSIFIYFAGFSALAYSTPGQAAMGLCVRNFDGQFPTRQESLLRAFGYLVSIASVMLGFLWATMDSDGLAWHDHISGTVLVEKD